MALGVSRWQVIVNGTAAIITPVVVQIIHKLYEARLSHANLVSTRILGYNHAGRG